MALGLGHKIQINVMATLEVADFSPVVFGICQLSWVIKYIYVRGSGLVRVRVDLDVFQASEINLGEKWCVVEFLPSTLREVD